MTAPFSGMLAELLEGRKVRGFSIKHGCDYDRDKDSYWFTLQAETPWPCDPSLYMEISHLEMMQNLRRMIPFVTSMVEAGLVLLERYVDAEMDKQLALPADLELEDDTAPKTENPIIKAMEEHKQKTEGKVTVEGEEMPVTMSSVPKCGSLKIEDLPVPEQPAHLKIPAPPWPPAPRLAGGTGATSGQYPAHNRKLGRRR